MGIVSALGFVVFGVFVGLLLVFWYVVRRLNTDPHATHAFIRSAVGTIRNEMTPERYHALFPEHMCPCCEQRVDCFERRTDA